MTAENIINIIRVHELCIAPLGDNLWAIGTLDRRSDWVDAQVLDCRWEKSASGKTIEEAVDNLIERYPELGITDHCADCGAGINEGDIHGYCPASQG